MNLIKYIAAAALAIMATGSTDAQKYFKILDATSMSWSGGMPQSGTGTTYTIRIILLTGEKITFSDIWIGKEYGVPEAVSATYSDGRRPLKGDTMLVRYTIHRYSPQSPMSQVPKPAYKDPPAPLKGEALLGFTAGKETRYRSVDKFRPLPLKQYQ